MSNNGLMQGLLGHRCANPELAIEGNWSTSSQQAPDGLWCFWWIRHQDGGICHDSTAKLTKQAWEDAKPVYTTEVTLSE